MELKRIAKVQVVLGVLLGATTWASSAVAGSILDGVSVRFVDIEANDIAADPSRGVVYATVPGAAGLPNGNSIVTIDPTSGTVIDSSFAGSEPRATE